MGPIVGPATYAVIAVSLFPVSKRFATIAPPITIGTPPKNPATALAALSQPMLRDTAHNTVNAVKHRAAVLVRIARPHTSDMGPDVSIPKAVPIT
jgi:hypothetical protein